MRRLTDTETAEAGPDRIAAAVDGDGRALQEILARIEPDIVRYCRAQIGYRHRGPSCADDVAQEALIGVIRSLHRFHGDEDGLLPFAYAIARHKVSDFYRQRSRERSTPVDEPPETPDTEDGPDHAVLRAELRAQVNDLLNTLSWSHRQVLELRMLAGMSIQEVASMTASTPGAVRVRQHRALTNLRSRVAARALV